MKRDSHEFRDRVLAAVDAVPEGRVSTYGDIAALIGVPRAARGVGFVLGSLPDDSIIPWWRIVNRAGGISIRHMGGRIQRMLLEREGVEFSKADLIDLARYRWDG